MARMSINERRQALLGAAFSVIAKDNLNAATTRAICAEAGMPLASFHYAFESYNDFIAALIGEVMKIDAFSLMGQTVPQDDLLESVRASFRTFLDKLVAEPGQASLMLELWLLVNRTPGLKHLTPLINQRFKEIAVEALTSLESYGFEWDASIEELSFQANVIANGLAMGYAGGAKLEDVYRAADGLSNAIAAQGRLGKKASLR